MGTQQMILYTVAALIVAFVFFILFGVQRRSGEAAIDATTYRAAKQDMLNLVEAIEQDFKNVGSYLYMTGPGTFVGETTDPANMLNPVTNEITPVIIKFDTEVVPYTFEFLAQVDSMSPPVQIRYEWEPIDGKTITLNDGTTRQLYEVKRLIDDGGGFTLSGMSNTITEMNIELLPDTTTGVTTLINLHDARVIRASLTGVSRLGKGETIEETRFDAVYRPVPMIIKDNAN